MVLVNIVDYPTIIVIKAKLLILIVVINRHRPKQRIVFEKFRFFLVQYLLVCSMAFDHVIIAECW